MRNIYLIGFMGVGKSTVATELANAIGVKCVEMDVQLAEEQGMSISEIFERFGEAYFRNLETELLRSFTGTCSLVVSCGGGIVLREENTKQMRENGRIVLLKAEPQTIYERIKDDSSRPVLNGSKNAAYIQELMEKRREYYDAAADIAVETDGKSVQEICQEILGWAADERERDY